MIKHFKVDLNIINSLYEKELTLWDRTDILEEFGEDFFDKVSQIKQEEYDEQLIFLSYFTAHLVLVRLLPLKLEDELTNEYDKELLQEAKEVIYEVEPLFEKNKDIGV